MLAQNITRSCFELASGGEGAILNLAKPHFRFKATSANIK